MCGGGEQKGLWRNCLHAQLRLRTGVLMTVQYLLNILWAGSYFYKADSIIIESCHIYVVFEAAPEILLLIAYA